MRLFNHYLLTRFNICIYDHDVVANRKEKLDPEAWAKYRWPLFLKYCVPSIKAQTNQDFQWLVFFDERTPNKEKYMDIGMDNYHPIFHTKRPEAMIKFHTEWMKKHSAKYILTSRVDCDDALHMNMIQKVQDVFLNDSETQFSRIPDDKDKKGVGLNYLHGYCYNIDTKETFHTMQLNNPFVSFLERARPNMIMSCYRKGGHTKFNQFYHVYLINKEKPMWIQVVHKNNAANHNTGKPIPIEQFRYKEFGWESL
jgi:hypothetical protein